MVSDLSANEIAIVGAGPAGLATAAHLKRRGITADVLEQSSNIANKWHQHYDRLHLHSVKRLSHLPFVEFPAEYPTYVPRLELIRYFEDYARKLDIQSAVWNGSKAPGARRR